MYFDSEKAVVDMTNALVAVKDMLGVTEEDIKKSISVELLDCLQRKRFEYLPIMEDIKKEFEERFPYYRIDSRIKALSSIIMKILTGRKILDVFAFRIITENQDQAYALADLIKDEYGPEFSFEDKVKCPKKNGYQDLQLIIPFRETYIEVIIQTQRQYVDACTIQRHDLKYPWKYADEIQNLPVEYREVIF